MTVKYFPHYVKSGRTIYILENHFGNDGYAFWFKLLEILGETEGHGFDCTDAASWEYLVAKTKVDKEKAEAIIGVLVSLGKLDKELWETKRIIWCENFVNHLREVYRKRKEDLPSKTGLSPQKPDKKDISAAETTSKEGLSPQKPDKKDISAAETTSKEGLSPQKPDKKDISAAETTSKEGLSPQKPDKVKESKVKKSIEKQVSLYESIFDSWNAICGEVLPKVSTRSATRRAKIESRLKDFRVWGDDEVAIAWAQALFTRVAQTPFLCGENKSLWRADFDWLFKNAENPDKVINGKYDDKPLRPSAEALFQGDITLGVGEFIDTQTGRRTYGTGRYTVPPAAPPRPGEKYQWSSESQTWIML